MKPIAICISTALLLAGCGGPVTYDVSGTVTFDGVPVEKGEISFVPTEKGQSSDGGQIEQGRFRLSVKPGSKIVQIRASRPLPPEKQDNPTMGLLYEDYIPAEFNSDSTLKEEIGPGGKTNFTFDLKSSAEQ